MTDNYFKTSDQEGVKLKSTQMYTHTYTIQGKMFKIAYLNSRLPVVHVSVCVWRWVVFNGHRLLLEK